MEQKIKILGERLSPFVERVFLQVQAKGLQDTIEFAPTGWEDIKSPEYLEINPFGKMPSLKWGEFTLFESTVIMEFIEDMFPENPMLPEDPKERAQVRLVVRILDMYYHNHTVALLTQVQARERNQKFVDRHLKGISESLDTLEDMAGGKKYFIGNTLTLADTTLYASILLGHTFAPGFGQDYFGRRPKLKAWYDAMKVEPLFVASNKVRSAQVADFIKNRNQLKEAG